MRLRNIPCADEAIRNSAFCIGEPQEHQGHWQDLFPASQPLHIEIGMGKGRFLMDSAVLNPGISYIGIERYSSVLYRAIQKMEQLSVPNLRFLCMDASDIDSVFATGEVERIYLNFSDPWPKDRHAGRRLTSRQFLARYDRILAGNGCIEFKTDNQNLFMFSMEELNECGWKIRAFTRDLHHDPAMNEGNIMTEYEEKFSSMGNPICKLIAER